VNLSRYLGASAALAMTLFSGCGSPHGQPRKGSEALAPSEVLEFSTLYSENCAGCHGAEGRGGAAIALADPVYLGIVDETAMRKHIADGVRGTSMPAFAQSAGGMLTGKQIDVNRSTSSAAKSDRAGAGREFLTAPIRLPMPRNPRATPIEAKPRTRHIANLATVRKGKADRRAAPSPMILFWRWSAIRACARWSSLAVPNWVRPTGAATFPASRCRNRKSPMSLPGSPHAGSKTRDSLIRFRITSSTRSSDHVE
jgi:mono/diheme cytochrome c family protein